MSKKKIPTLSDIVSGEVTPIRSEISRPQEQHFDSFAVNQTGQGGFSQAQPVRRQTQVTATPQPKTEDKKNRASTTVYLPPKVKRQLEELWFAERHHKSQNDIFLEGLDFVFRNRGLPSISELMDDE